MAPQAQQEILVRLLDDTVYTGVRTGNNAAWQCQCGRSLPLIGYSDSIDSASQHSLVICPEPNCGRHFRVVAPGKKKVPSHVQEITESIEGCPKGGYRRMSKSGQSWLDYFKSIFIPELETYALSLTDRLLPSFDSLDDEAKLIEQDEYERLINSFAYDDGIDKAYLDERAMDKAIVYVRTVNGIRQGLLNMFAAGLYHLFEQQLLLYHRSDLLIPGEQNNPAFLNRSKATEILADHSINLKTWSSWARIDELKLLANTVKVTVQGMVS